MDIRLKTTLLCAVLLVVSGCTGKKTYKLVPVKGIVKIDGQAAGNILVQFMPDFLEKNEGPTSQATSGADGTFELHTVADNKPGAVVGKHIVILIDTEEERTAQGEAESSRPSRLSARYSTAAGGVKVEVIEGQEVVIDVTSE